jgi:ribosome-associated heat shock protein Hsp15
MFESLTTRWISTLPYPVANLSDSPVRLDKWLWAARFFKTRALANAAIAGGKVQGNGQRLRPARAVKVGDCYSLRRGHEIVDVIVVGLSAQRGSASVAQGLYRETETSVARRAAVAEKLELARLQRPVSTGRPDKKQRRKIRQFIEKP